MILSTNQISFHCLYTWHVTQAENADTKLSFCRKCNIYNATCGIQEMLVISMSIFIFNSTESSPLFTNSTGNYFLNVVVAGNTFKFPGISVLFKHSQADIKSRMVYICYIKNNCGIVIK